MVDAVNLQAVTFQGEPLGEGLFAVVATVWTDSCMCTRMPLQIKCIIEAFSTGATGKPRRVIFTSHWWQLFTLLLLRHISHHWVLDAVTAIDELQMGVLGNAVTLLEDEDTLLQVVDAKEVFLLISVP